MTGKLCEIFDHRALYDCVSVIASAPIRRTWLPTSEDDHRLVRDELNRILQSPPFQNSRRYPALLKYVVENALAGTVDRLKERIIGVEVFNRPLDYDTSDDPIVRFTAGEVRKRIAQFYRDGNSHGPIEITLPVGCYVPQFYRLATGDDKASNIDSSPLTFDLPGQRKGRTEHTIQRDTGLPFAPAHPQPDFSDRPLVSHQRRHVLLTLPGFALGIALLLSAVACVVYRAHQAATPILTVWGPLVKSPDPVLISVGRPQSEEQELPMPADMTIAQHFLRPEFRVSMTAVAAISQVAGFLESQHKRFQIHEASSNNLQDLHGHPVVLVNADNKWTLLLLRPLRFHFVKVGDFLYIEDSEHPEKRDWSVDFTKPFLKQDIDYAIVARFHDATSGGPVIVIAGISSNGTEAAGEFVVSPEQLNTLAGIAPQGSLDRNFEAVLKVEVVGGNTGATTIVASQFW